MPHARFLAHLILAAVLLAGCIVVPYGGYGGGYRGGHGHHHHHHHGHGGHYRRW